MRIVRGEDATTSFSAGRRVVLDSTRSVGHQVTTWNTDPPGSPLFQKIHHFEGDEALRRIGTPGIPGDPFSQIPQDVISRVNTRVINQLYDARRLCAGGQILGELRQTINMLRNPAIALRKGLSSYLETVSRKGKRIKGRRPLERMVKDTWLEYTFGWKPLIRDTQDIATALAERVELMRPPKVPLYASESVQLPLSVSGTQVGDTAFVGAYSFNYRYKVMEVEKEASYRVKGAAKTWVASTSSRALFGLNIEDIAPTIWELIPWSFALDYFMNVGNIINSLSYPSADVVYLVSTKRYRCITRIDLWQGDPPLADNPIPPGGGMLSVDSFSFSSSHARYLTTCISRDSIAPNGLAVFLDFKLPSFKQAVNLEALRGQSRATSRSLRL